MMRRTLLGVALLGAFVLTATAVAAFVPTPFEQVPAEQVGMSAKKLERIREVLKGEIDKGMFPGTVVLVARKGKLIYADAAGMQDKNAGKAMALNSVFRIYSMTKPFVSVAAMMLVEDGKMQLTDPVSKFLPAFKNQRVSVARADAEFARITYTNVAAAARDDGAGPAAPHVGSRLRRDHAERPDQGCLREGRRLSARRARLQLARHDAGRAGRARGRGAARAPARNRVGIQPVLRHPRTRGRSGLRQAAQRIPRRAIVQAAGHGRHLVLRAGRQGRAGRATAGDRPRERPADQGDRRVGAAEERFRRRGRRLDRGRLSALHPDAAQRRTAQRRARALAHHGRADDVRPSRHAHRRADDAGRASARHAGLRLRPRLRRAARARRRRRAGLGGRVHVGRLCRHLFLGRSRRSSSPRCS